MIEIGVPYILTGPDGTRAVFQDPTDPDFVGYLDSESGITGLLDTAEVRETYQDRSEGDGGVQGDNFLGRRVGTLQGIIWPSSPAVQEGMISKVKRASRGLKGASPSVLTWTPTSDGIQRAMKVWRQSKVTFTARRPKQFLIPLSCPNEYVFSAGVNTQIILPTASQGGFSSPMTDPIISNEAAQGQGYVTNVGDAPSWPVFVFSGPITNPGILNNSVGLSWTVDYSIQAGDTLIVDSYRRTVKFNGVDVYSAFAVNYPGNKWWQLQPGANDLRLFSAAYSSGAQVQIQWQHAWE